MKSRAGFVGVAGLIAVTAVALVAACASEEVPLVETPPSGVTAIAPSPQAGPEIPTLTAEQEAQVEDIIAGDSTLRQILDGRAYSIEDMGPWHTGALPETGDFLLIGATAKIALSEPIPRVERDWPHAVYRPYYHLWPSEIRAQYLPYREGSQRVTVDNLNEMYVLVDLDREKLVEVTVLDLPDGQKVSYPAGPWPEPAPGGEALARQIFEGDERVEAVLGGRDYGIQAVWAGSYQDSRLASVIVQWDERQDIEADWPLLIDFDEETGACEVQAIHFTAETVGRLDVLIDLDEQQVVAIEPSVGD